MDPWKLAMAVPPLLAWFGLFLYLGKIDKKLKAIEERMGESRR